MDNLNLAAVPHIALKSKIFPMNIYDNQRDPSLFLPPVQQFLHQYACQVRFARAAHG